MKQIATYFQRMLLLAREAAGSSVNRTANRRPAAVMDTGGFAAVGDLDRIYRIDAADIGYHISDRKIGVPVPKFGIVDGDWDMNRVPLEQTRLYRVCAMRFIDDVPWEEMGQIRNTIRKLAAGATLRALDVSPDRQTPEVYWEYLQYLDRLYQKIKSEGYKSQEELAEEDDFCNRKPNRVTNEIQVAIGRNGEFMVKDGQHRTVIARLLSIEGLPVRTRIRHAEWQAIRETIATAQSPKELPEHMLVQLRHPDLQDIVPESWQSPALLSHNGSWHAH